MELTEVLQQAEDRLDHLRSDRERLRGALEENEAEGKKMASLVAALREVMATFGTPEQQAKAAAPPLAQETETAEWSALSRTDATLRALADADHPVGPTEIVDILRSHGRSDDTIHLISAALSYLKRRGKAGTIGHGQWVPHEKLPGTSTKTTTQTILDAAQRIGDIYERRDATGGAAG